MDKNQQYVIKIIYISIFLNAALALTKGITGYYGNSYALIADGIESTSDIFSSLLLLFGLKYASRPADINHPYGHGRAEPLVTFLAGVFLVISAGVIAYQSVQNIITPDAPPKSYTLIVLAIVMIVKELFYRLVLHKGKQTGSSTLKADAWHHRSDAITSLAVFTGISISLIGGNGFEVADDWAALIASGIILYNSYLIFRPALAEIMDESMYDELVSEIRKVAMIVPGVVDTEKCLIRKSGMKYFVDLHTTVNGDISVTQGHEIAHDLKATIMKELPQIADVLIHVEPGIY